MHIVVELGAKRLRRANVINESLNERELSFFSMKIS